MKKTEEQNNNMFIQNFGNKIESINNSNKNVPKKENGERNNYQNFIFENSVTITIIANNNFNNNNPTFKCKSYWLKILKVLSTIISPI